MRPYSQVGQDLFAYEKIGEHGTFLDVGCRDWNLNNNTLALEEIGWNGLSIDIDESKIIDFKNHRTTSAVHANAVFVMWAELLPKFGLSSDIDYLSLDIDGQELVTLGNMFNAGMSFRVITCEHNAYMWGSYFRDALRKLLTDEGYTLAKADVCDRDKPFEDWWVL